MFRLWETIPPTTALSNLVATSFLVLTAEPPSAVLVRCSAGMEEGTVLVVHSNAVQPNAVRMHDVDATAPISSQRQTLGVGQGLRVVRIPHITWKHLGEGVRGRGPLTVIVALLAALLVMVLAPTLSTMLAAPAAAVTGLGTWLVLRHRIPTTIGPVDSSSWRVEEVVEYAASCTRQARTTLPLT
ncbi:MAG: hypothetical protein Q4P15_11820 [Propionibacteriaceae bacterium]|nr:hypothetical protein [Propionibacteriaceae bacterium]